MGYVSAIKPFSTLLAEEKCTTEGSNKEHTFPCKNLSLVKTEIVARRKVVRDSVIVCHQVQLKKGHLHKISHVHELLLGVSFLFGQYIGLEDAHRALNKQHGYSSKYLSSVFF